MTPDRQVVAALDALPTGSFRGTADGRRYIVTKTEFNRGRSVKLLAEEPGGTDRISLNLYKLASGPRLYPCEMSAAKVTRFLLRFRPDRTPDRPTPPRFT